jgi:predicted ATPase
MCFERVSPWPPKTGEGRVVLISGEAGIGKSRLAAAVDEATEDKPRTRLRWFCSPHHQGCANRILDDWPRRPSGMCSSGK